MDVDCNQDKAITYVGLSWIPCKLPRKRELIGYQSALNQARHDHGIFGLAGSHLILSETIEDRKLIVIQLR